MHAELVFAGLGKINERLFTSRVAHKLEIPNPDFTHRLSTLGPEHTDTLTSMGNLACTYRY